MDTMHEDGSCGRWEAAITELHDGRLAPEEEMRLREHAADCNTCGALLGEGERGRAWARLLPLATGIGGELTLPHPAAMRGQREARVLMTVAMAFFSVALTWSVTGLRLQDLEPNHVQAAMSRQFFGAKKEVVSFYDNLRVIREIEVTVESLRKPATPGPDRPQPSARRGNAASLLAGVQTAPSERTAL